MLQGFGLSYSRERLPLNLPDQPVDPLYHLPVLLLPVLLLPVQIILPPGKDMRLLMSISVREPYWNQGIGKKLIQQAVKKARETGMKKVEIGTGNPGVVQMLLYQKCGFRITGVEFDYFRKHCAEKIIENEIECRDMVRMGMRLDEERQKEG